MAELERFPFVEQKMSMTVSFRINGVEDLLTHPTPSKPTAYFYPGYYLDVFSSCDKATGKGTISVFLKPQPGNIRLPVRLELSAWSLARTTRYQERHLNHQRYIHDTRGWRNFIAQDDYDKHETMRHENAILLEAKITCNLTPRKAHKPSFDVVYDHVTEKKPKREVTYKVYSGKTQTGRLCRPRTLYSSLDILEANGIDVYKLETTGLALVEDGTNKHRRPVLSPEGFAEDSDFEERSEDKDVHEDVGNDIALAATGSASKSQMDDDASTNVAPVPDDSEILSPPQEVREENVTITGAAADTWEAFLFWLYTGHIVFAPMKNGGARARRRSIDMHRTSHPRRPAPCSCKSILYIASKLDVDPLKQLALRHLENVLTEKTILKELFTPFTAKHEEVKTMEVVAVVKHWITIRDSQALKDKMDEIAEGKLPHAGRIMADLLIRAALTEKPQSPT